MWELFFNGLNIAGSLASISSFASGFSLERDIRKMQESIHRLENFETELRQGTFLKDMVARTAIPALHEFRQTDEPERWRALLNSVVELSLRREIEKATRDTLGSVVAEMRETLDAVKFEQANTIEMPRNLLRGLLHRPRSLDIGETWDITNGGLWAHRNRCIMTPQTTPITWGDPMTGRMYLAAIPNQTLAGFGLKVATPHYRETIDGHVYSSMHGLYLPQYLVRPG